MFGFITELMGEEEEMKIRSLQDEEETAWKCID